MSQPDASSKESLEGNKENKEKAKVPVKKKCNTKSGATVFELGYHQESIRSYSHINQLPTAKEVLLYLYFRKRLPDFYKKPVKSVIACPFITGTTTAGCLGPGGCCESGQGKSKCILAALKLDGCWLKSCLPMLSDLAIVKKVSNLKDM